MKSNQILKWFYALMGVLITLFLVLLLRNPLGAQLNVFFAKTNNLFADFFNVMIYIAEKDVYFNPVNGPQEKIYFPLAYMFMRLFSGFADYSHLRLGQVYSVMPAMVSFLLFTLGSIFLFFHSLNKVSKLNTRMALVLCLSSVFLYTIERGNLILIAAACAFFFIAYKDSQKPWQRYLALLLLCVSVVLKGYPVVLGLYLLQDKRWNDIAFCTVTCLLLAFLPFLYFEHGIDNIPQFFNNVRVSNEAYSTAIFPRYGLIVYVVKLFSRLMMTETALYHVCIWSAKGIVYLLSLLSVLLFFKQDTPWKKLLMISFIIAWFPANNAFYCGVFFIPSLVLFLNQKQFNRRDFLYMILFCLFLNPVQILFEGRTISWMISCMSMLAMWVLLLQESACVWMRNLRKA